jgi:hypothetical protein
MVRQRRTTVFELAALLLGIAAFEAAAQGSGVRDSALAPRPLGGIAGDRARLDFRLTDNLILSASSSWKVSDSIAALRVAPLPVSAELTWNSTLPYSMNDGPQWAGRGGTLQLNAGVQASYKSLHAILWPAVWVAQNAPFPVLPGAASRSAFSSPYQVGGLSADVPIRFGNERILAIDPGESAVWVTQRNASVGFATESQWWGPGIRNALVLSNNAGGFPHLFARTARPIATRIGSVEAKWILGGLTESQYFDRDPANDLRSISGIVATFSPSFLQALTAGVTRVVFDDASGSMDIASHAFDPLLRWGPDVNPRNVVGGAEQLTSAFARWVFPASGAEIYGEWARMLLPITLRELLVAPQFTQGFTIGFQWLPRVTDRSRLRMQIELTNLEQSPESRMADTLSFYTSTVVPQGYTQRGQVIGASIGPGSSSQWLAFDQLWAARSLGVFVGRIRWNTDAHYTTPQSDISIYSYDASVFGGMRSSTRLWNRDLSFELTLQRRYNFLFQNDSYGFSRGPAFDKNNVTLRLRSF